VRVVNAAVEHGDFDALATFALAHHDWRFSADVGDRLGQVQFVVDDWIDGDDRGVGRDHGECGGVNVQDERVQRELGPAEDLDGWVNALDVVENTVLLDHDRLGFALHRYEVLREGRCLGGGRGIQANDDLAAAGGIPKLGIEFG